jgi:hypothetical protein
VKDLIMVQEAENMRHEEMPPKPSHKPKANVRGNKDPISMMAEMAQKFDPQTMFTFSELGDGDFQHFVEANADMMRAYDKIFQSWANGFSTRNEERIHTLEKMAKCRSQEDAMKLQNDCMQRVTKHWMADQQKLTSTFFDAFGKAIKENNTFLSGTLKKSTEKLTNP